MPLLTILHPNLLIYALGLSPSPETWLISLLPKHLSLSVVSQHMISTETGPIPLKITYYSPACYALHKCLIRKICCPTEGVNGLLFRSCPLLLILARTHCCILSNMLRCLA